MLYLLISVRFMVRGLNKFTFCLYLVGERLDVPSASLDVVVVINILVPAMN